MALSTTALPVASDSPVSISNLANFDMMNTSRNVLTVGRNLMAGCLRRIPGGQDTVDDLAVIVAAGCVRRILSGQDTGICTARDLKEARAWLKVAQGFVAVICEEKLSDGAGRELLRWLRQEKKNEIPFLLLCTELPRPGRQEPGLEMLGNPFHADRLRESLCRLGLLSGARRPLPIRFAGGPFSPDKAALAGLSAFSPA